MKLTTIDIIKLLPLDEDLKTDLILRFDKLTADQKFNFERLVWNSYDGIYMLQLQKNIETGLLDVKLKKEHLDNEFYTRMRQKTEIEMSKGTMAVLNNDELTHVREKLQNILDQKRN